MSKDKNPKSSVGTIWKNYEGLAKAQEEAEDGGLDHCIPITLTHVLPRLSTESTTNVIQHLLSVAK